MRKIPSVFVYRADRSGLVTDEVTPGCEWVLAGEGVATAKWDGTACCVRDGKLFGRYDAKRGKMPPAGAIPCDTAPDPVTGHWPHWVPIEMTSFAKQAEDALRPYGMPRDGTYELIGPKVNGNPHGTDRHALIAHGNFLLHVPDRSFAGLRARLDRPFVDGAPRFEFEGIVFHHRDGRMAKIRRDQFGLPWPFEGKP